VRKATQENSTFENIRRLICLERNGNVAAVIRLSLTSVFLNNTSSKCMPLKRIGFYVPNAANSSEVNQI